MTVGEFDPHALEPEEFFDQVYSFEFWLHAVDGYLTDRPYGRSDDSVDVELGDSERDRLITTLCNYCVGETAALEGASGMIKFAPNRHAKIFLATQVADEARHLEVFMRRLGDLGVADAQTEIAKRAGADLVAFKDRLLEFVADGDWNAALFAQNVILETMESTVFRSHAETADPVTAEVLDGVIKDERRHLGFGENNLGAVLVSDPSARWRLLEVKAELDGLVLAAFDGALDDLGVATSERQDLGREYLTAIDRLGLL